VFAEMSSSWERGTWPPPHILYGGDYNPEQWPPEVWREDAALMREAGVNLVTVGVFSWASLEPSPGEFEFGWLQEVLDLLGDAGVAADLATPTAAPPPWLPAQYPETLPVDANGVRYSYGSRQHFCVHSPAYRRHAARIVGELARRLGHHPAVRMWHLHNEYACHVPQCFCNISAVAFREWLRRRYGTVAALNDAWGTAFWSQRYRSFDEILPPRVTPAHPNPTQQLDFHRFWSDSYLEEFAEERDVLRSVTPELPVTTNFMAFFKPLDYFAWGREEDLCATDNYPDPSDPDSPMLTAMHYDLVRSLRKDTSWLVMEQATFRVNWRPVNSAKAPGEMRRGCYQALARGAAGNMFFQWRASAAGAEKFHSAMLGHAGTASPVWHEVTALGAEFARLGELTGARVAADCAIAFSWPNWWALELGSKPSAAISMLGQLRWMYRPLFEAGRCADFVRPGDDDLSGYPLLVVPSLYLLTEAEGASICSYVKQGGTAVITFWSGIVDELDHVYPGSYGGPLRELLGGAVVDVAPLQPGETVEVSWRDGRRSAAGGWLDIIEEGDGDVLASYESGPWAGRPAVLGKRLGAGQAYYLGTRLDDEAVGELLRLAAGNRRGSGGAQPVTGVERVVRRTDETSYEFLINHTGCPAEVPLAGGGLELLSGSQAGERLELPPQGVAIVRRETEGRI
jgi:beta-galactosidase